MADALAVTDERLAAVHDAISLIACRFGGAPGPASPIDLEMVAQQIVSEVLSDTARARRVLFEVVAVAAGALSELARTDGDTGPAVLAWLALQAEQTR